MVSSSSGRTDHEYDEFYRRNYKAALRIAIPILAGAIPIAEEAVQDAFLDVATKWSKVSSYDRPESYLKRVVVHRAISARRSADRIRSRENRSTSEKSAATWTDESLEIFAIVRHLPKRQAQVIALVHFDQLTLTEAAEVLGIGYESARTHHQRGINHLRQVLDVQEPSEKGISR